MSAGRTMKEYEGLFPDDKRTDFRFESNLSLNLRYNDPVSKKRLLRKGRSINISKEGLTFTTRTALPKILQPQLEIVLPQPYHAITTKAQVVWRNDKTRSYGAKFIELESHDLVNLEQYLNRTTDPLRIVLDQRILAPTGRHKAKVRKHEVATFRKASSQQDLEDIYSIRKEVFIKEDKYPIEAIKSNYDKQAIHFVAFENNKMVGTVSVILDGPKGLPIQKFVDITRFRDKRMVQVEKFAVLPGRRKKTITVALIVMAYEFAKLYADRICIFSLEKKRDNILLYRKMGFRPGEKFNFYDIGDALLMILDIEKDSVYEKLPDRSKHFKRYIRRLSKTLDIKS